MSETINNREYRQNVIKNIILQLQEGKTVEEVRPIFEKAFDGVSAKEISDAEQALIAEGLPIAEVQRLCDVHAAVFKGSIEEIHAEKDLTKIPGHPANTMIRENRAIERIIKKEIEPYVEELSDSDNIDNLLKGFQSLSKIEIHYLKKENLLFPYMEKYNITAPPKVMWGVDDEIRAQIKEIIKLLQEKTINPKELREKIDTVIEQVREMIFKEESILLPMVMETLTEDEWKHIADESGEVGFLVDKVPVWTPSGGQNKDVADTKKPKGDKKGEVVLPSGSFTIDELTAMLNTLPFDITFVDKNDMVKYFSQGKERIFLRSTAVLGRNVSNCHPPGSVNIVEQIVIDFKEGKKDHEDFWILMGDKYALIRYFAVRDEKGEYLGVLEVTQNIKPIQEITGEKRLVSKE